MSLLKELASIILIKDTIIVEKTDELMDRILKMSIAIYCNPEQRKGRTAEQVYNSTQRIAIEHALVMIDPERFMLNPLEHDKTNRHSYAFDAIDKQSGCTLETKRYTSDKPDGTRATWLTYPRESFRTLHKNKDIVDFLIAGKMVCHPKFFEVGFHLIADVNSLKRYLRESNYRNKKYPHVIMDYYNHFHAHENGHCEYNYNQVKYRNRTSWNSDTQYQYSKSA